MLSGGEKKVRMVGWVRVSAGGGEERECKCCHGGELGWRVKVIREWRRCDLLHLGFYQVSGAVVVSSHVEWRNSYSDNSLKRVVQHDNGCGGLAAMEDVSVVVFSRLGCCGFLNFPNLAHTQQLNH
ncbi:hypothetical protein LR48_Vigan09g250300 [Vigna angularis]|uniref:Uncharacterized protein n=1 Tax=Phaseolus angularis TaxID=3914 RepID=A0A0L9VGL2_PHAAN|nr:hypothetical protein LR48_Vigan09g250300 [Vigna angularis]